MKDRNNLRTRIISSFVDFLFWQKVVSIRYDKPAGKILSLVMDWNYRWYIKD